MLGRRSDPLSHFSLLTCLTLGVVMCAPTPLPIQLSVEDRCEDWVLLSYQPNPPLPAAPPLQGDHLDHAGANKSMWSSCEVRYWKASNPKRVNIVPLMYDYPNTARSILVGSLSPHNNYIFYMACHEHFTSNKLTFKTGLGCLGDEKRGQQHQHSTPVMLLREHALTQSSSIDITLGVIFGIFGTVILAAAAFYLWKSHQRRQRILRLFGQEYRDPFQVMDSLEESSIISL